MSSIVSDEGASIPDVARLEAGATSNKVIVLAGATSVGKSKVAQLTVQRKQQAEEALTTSAKLSAISRSQVDCAERLEKLSTASAYTNRTISQMLAQVQQQGDESFRPVSVGRPAQPGMRRFSSSPNR